MAKYSKEKNQETILAIILGLLVIWYFTGTRINTLVIVSIFLSLTALFSQWLSGWITFFWTKLSHVMGWVMSKVILSIIFYLFLFPIALLARLFGNNPMRLKKSSESSYYVDRNHTYSSGDLENPW